MVQVILTLLTIVGLVISEPFSLSLRREYRSKRMLADENGDFYHNPDFFSKRNLETYTSDIMNANDIEYYGKLYFSLSGTTESREFLFDTGSAWLWANADGCSGCPSTEYLASSQYENCDGTQKEIGYGSGTISGETCETTVSVTSSTDQAVTGLKMVAVTTGNLNGISGKAWDGIVGLMPTSLSGSELLVSEMKSQGVISDAVFGVSYTLNADDSEIMFGGYDSSKVPSFDNFTFTDLDGSGHWQVNLRHVKYGDTTLTMTASSALIDTGSSYFLLPNDAYNEWVTSIAQTHDNCQTLGSFYACDCDEVTEFDNFKILFDNWEYQITPENYVVKYHYGSYKLCYFLMGGLPSTSSRIVLGDTFIRNYYIYHDMDNSRIGMYGDYMTHYDSDDNYIWLIGLGAIALVALIAIVICCCCIQRGRKEAAKQYREQSEQPETPASPSDHNNSHRRSTYKV